MQLFKMHTKAMHHLGNTVKAHTKDYCWRLQTFIDLTIRNHETIKAYIITIAAWRHAIRSWLID